MISFIGKTIRTASQMLPALVLATALGAQTPAADPSARLRAVLPAEVAERVIARITEARSRELPAQALENRALKFAARGIAPAEIERSVNAHADRMQVAARALRDGRPLRPADTEVEAGAEAMRQGVDGAAVSALAKSAPSGRSLAVPLFVLGNLVERGLASDDALARVQARILARATDAELERMPTGAGRPAHTGPGMAGTRHPATMPGTMPATMPRNGGTGTMPGNRPPTMIPPPEHGRRP